MNTISRSYTFSAAHRIEGHPKCGRLHGHNYVVTVQLFGIRDADTGMLLDYGLLDEVVKPLIDSFDHRYIVSQSNIRNLDPYINAATLRGDIVQEISLSLAASTAECLSDLFVRLIRERLVERHGHAVATSIVVDVQETERSHASCMLEIQ